MKGGKRCYHDVIMRPNPYKPKPKLLAKPKIIQTIPIEFSTNKWEKACKEWLKGCTCSSPGNQEQCKPGTKAFHNHLRYLAVKENYKELDSYTM